MFWTVGFWADSPFFVYENRKEIRMKKKDTNRLIIDNYAFAKIGNRKVDLNPKLKQKFIDETRNLPIKKNERESPWFQPWDESEQLGKQL